MKWQRTASIRSEQREIGVDSTMKQECDISMKRSEITDEEFSGVFSTLKAVTYWVQLSTKKCV
jgi:hypothetical protein